MATLSRPGPWCMKPDAALAEPHAASGGKMYGPEHEFSMSAAATHIENHSIKLQSLQLWGANSSRAVPVEVGGGVPFNSLLAASDARTRAAAEYVRARTRVTLGLDVRLLTAGSRARRLMMQQCWRRVLELQVRVHGWADGLGVSFRCACLCTSKGPHLTIMSLHCYCSIFRWLFADDVATSSWLSRGKQRLCTVYDRWMPCASHFMVQCWIAAGAGG